MTPSSASTTFERSAAIARRFNGFAMRVVGGALGEEVAARLTRAMGKGDEAYLTLLGACEAGFAGRPDPSDSVRLADAYARIFERAGFTPAAVRALFEMGGTDGALPEERKRYAATLKRKDAAAFARVLGD